MCVGGFSCAAQLNGFVLNGALGFQAAKLGTDTGPRFWGKNIFLYRIGGEHVRSSLGKATGGHMLYVIPNREDCYVEGK
jgi:hypothetical protein